MAWLQFPDGTERITVERQEFSVEVRDDAGHGFFRLPDHFVPRVLAVGGFRVTPPPTGAPEDHTAVDPLRDGALSELLRENETLKQKLTDVTADKISDEAGVRALTQERNGYRDEVNALKDANAFLTERLTEFEDAQATRVAAAAKAAGKKS